MRFRFGRKSWPTWPGVAVCAFSLASIVLPVGSHGLGADLGDGGGPTLAARRWARDIHDGFWSRPTADAVRGTFSFHAPGSDERRRAVELCAAGRAREAVAIYDQIGALTATDQQALMDLAAHLLCDADYAECEWFAREGDRLLGGSRLRNNLAWFYTQRQMRPRAALDLALGSVADARNATNVDTLAWAYWNADDPERARLVATETLAFDETYLTTLSRHQQAQAQASSRELLTALDSGLSLGEHLRAMGRTLPTE